MTSIANLANYIYNLPMFPVFDLAHDYIAAAIVRKAFGAQYASRSLPSVIISWSVTMACAFAGEIFANLLIAFEPLAALKNIVLLLLASAVWFGVCYAPNDMVYYYGESFPAQVILNTLKEIYRAVRISSIVSSMDFYYPNSSTITVICMAILIGTLMGNGDGIFREVRHMAVNTTSSGFKVKISLTTKLCFLASVIFVIQRKMWYSPISYQMVHLAIVLTFVAAKLSVLFKKRA